MKSSKFYRQTFRQVPVHDTPLLGALPLIAKLLVLYCAKHCGRDGSIPIRSNDNIAASLRHRFGGNPRETPIIERAVAMAREVGAIQEQGSRIFVVEFPLWQRKTLDTWRRLYVHEEVPFGRLPLFARALAVELMRRCNEHGVLALSARELCVWLASHGASRTERENDRRVLNRAIADLLAEGHLRAENGHLVIKNFRLAQSLATMSDAPAQDERRVSDAPAQDERRVSDAPAQDERRVSDAPAQDERRVSDAPAQDERRVETVVSTRNDSSADPLSIHKSIPACSVLGGVTDAPETANLDPQPFRLTPPPPAPPKRSKRPKPESLPLPAYVPEAGTAARILFDAFASESVFATLHQPGENCLRWVQMFGESLGVERMRIAVHSAAQYLTSPKVAKSGRRYSDLAAFMLNQFRMVLDREGPVVAHAAAPGPLATFGSPLPAPRGVVAVG